MKLPKSVALFWAVSQSQNHHYLDNPYVLHLRAEFSSDLERAPGARSIADENSGVTFGVVELRRCEAYEHFRSHPVLLGTLPRDGALRLGTWALKP